VVSVMKNLQCAVVICGKCNEEQCAVVICGKYNEELTVCCSNLW